MINKSVSVLLALIILAGLFSSVPVSASANETEESGFASVAKISNDEIAVTGKNSLGAMIAEEYEDHADNTEETAADVYDVEINEKTARIELNTLKDATLIVAVFDEDGNEMYGAGTKEVAPDDRIVEVTLNADPMPQYFFVKAFLLDKVSHLPLCKQYENDDYTQAKQAFFAKTTVDFDEERVLNLDDQKNDNFLVYNDETVLIDCEDGIKNRIAFADEENKVYKIENIDESVLSLHRGDIFSYDYGNGDLLIVKIASIVIDGTTATVTGEDVELEDVFDYIRIDAAQATGEASVDNNDLEEGVEFDGTDEQGIAPTGLNLIDAELSYATTLKYKIAEKKFGDSSLSGSLGMKVGVEIKCYYDFKLFKKDEVECSIKIPYEYNIKLSLELVAKKEHKLKLGTIGFNPLPCVFVEFTPSFIVKGKIKVDLSGKLTGQVGKSFKNGKFSDENKKAHFSAGLKIEGELFVGFSLEPKIGFVGNVITATMEAKAGVNITAAMEKNTESDPPDAEEKHLCSKCITGEGTLIMSVSFKLSLMDKKKMTWEAGELKLSAKLFDFYYSLDKNKFDFTVCPNKTNRQTITVLDKSTKKPIPNVDVNGIETDKNGKAVIYLKVGNQDVVLKKEDKRVTYIISVSKNAAKRTFTVDFANAENLFVDNNTDIVEENKQGVMQNGQCGDNAYYTLHSDGTLEITGTGDMWDYDYFYFGTRSNPWTLDSVCHSIKKCVISDGITSIGDFAFYILDNLNEVEIPDSVTSIGRYAFAGCDSLESVFLPDSVSIIGPDAFATCRALKSINIPDGVTEIGDSAFTSCWSLTSITIPDGITKIGSSAFARSKITTVRFPDKIFDIDSTAFNYTPWLNSQGEVVFIGKMLYLCKSGTKVDVTHGTEYINKRAFADCTDLKEITLPDGLVSIGEEAFLRCSGLTEITIPDSVINIGESAFEYCINLNSVKLSENMDRIQKNTFVNCISLSDVTLPKSIKTVGDNAFNSRYSIQPAYDDNYVTYDISGKSYTIWFDEEFPEALKRFFSNDTRINVIVLNPDTVIHSKSIGYTIVRHIEFSIEGNCEYAEKKENVTISGYPVSTAQAYAQENGFQFKSIGAIAETGMKHPADTGIAEIGTALTAPFEAGANAADIAPAGSQSKTYSRDGLVSGSEAVLLILEGTAETAVLSSEALLYITQKTADYGSVDMTSFGDFSEKDRVVLLLGECAHEDTAIQVTKEADDNENGMKVLECSKCGKVLDAEVIEAIVPETVPPTAENTAEPTDQPTAIPTEKPTLFPTGPPNQPPTDESAEPQPKSILGDVDADDEVTIVDATYIQRKLAGLPNETFNEAAADTDEDNDITVIDATFIQRWLAGLSSNENIGKPVA